MSNKEANYDFIARCSLIMAEREETLEEVGHAIGINKSMISRYLRGKHLPSIYILKKLSLYWNVSSDYLLEISEKRKIK